ncbi:MAG: alpha/beta hydrolase [Bacteroidota bacterium]|nr:alpha/beta hydrolase [Candidatus Kapabacteria bacterium]MDW8221079.1 alpha/beta hydrolase [Bacteroidota bacterium]
MLFGLGVWLKALFVPEYAKAQQAVQEYTEFSQLHYPFAIKYIELSNGVQIAYTDEGNANARETLIFIHGLGSYLPAWKRNIEVLRSEYRCIALDLPGYGKSSKGAYPISISFYAGVIAEMIDKLGLRQAVVCGHSMGGQIAIMLALKYPQKVKKLILCAPAGFEAFTEGEKQWFREAVTAQGVKLTSPAQIRTNIMNNFYTMPADAEFMITDRIMMRGMKQFDWYCWTIVQCVQAMVNEPVIDYLDQIMQPTLILYGENDNLIPNPFLHGGKTELVARVGASRIPNSTLVMVPRCGHFVQFDQSEIVNNEIRRFLHGNF